MSPATQKPPQAAAGGVAPKATATAAAQNEIKRLQEQVLQHLYHHKRPLTLCFYHQIADLQLAAQGMETERDFYFSKLRQIEVICQEMEDSSPLTQQILDVMYATEVSIQESPALCDEPHLQDGFIQPQSEEPTENDPELVVPDDQNYGYEEYEDEQEEY